MKRSSIFVLNKRNCGVLYCASYRISVLSLFHLETWGIDFDFAVIASEGWFEDLPIDFRDNLFK